MPNKLKPGPIGRSYDKWERSLPGKDKKNYKDYDSWVKAQAAPKKGQV